MQGSVAMRRAMWRGCRDVLRALDACERVPPHPGPLPPANPEELRRLAERLDLLAARTSDLPPPGTP